MSKKATKKTDELENVEQVLGKSEAFIEKYQKQLFTAAGIIVLVVLSVLAFRHFYLQPREEAAENEIYKAQSLFSSDSYDLALNGDEINLMGFKAITEEYGSTNTGNLANAYAGICCYKLEQYEDAIKYLSAFKGKDDYLSVSTIGLIGDSYIALGNTEKALIFFEKAGNAKNEVLSPLYLKKAGLVYEDINNVDKAEKSYSKIKEAYPKSQEAGDIDKYIARVKK